MTLKELQGLFQPKTYWKIEYVGDKKCKLHRPAYFLWLPESTVIFSHKGMGGHAIFLISSVKLVLCSVRTSEWRTFSSGDVSLQPLDKLSPTMPEQFQFFWNLGTTNANSGRTILV